MKITILDNTKKKKFIEAVETLGLQKIPQLLIKTGEERVKAYSGNLGTEELSAIWRILPIEGMGLYVGKDIMDKHGVREVRLSVDALHLWKEQITNSILQLTPEQEKQWFYGRNIELPTPQPEGFKAIKSSDGKDFIGTGKIGNKGLMLYNYLPKERRRKTSTLS